MNRRLRTILIIAGIIIVVLLVVPFLIPANQFRPTIEERASAALGRKVTLGNLSASLLSGSLSAQDLSIGDDPSFSSSPFLTAKSLKVRVKLLPLIFSKTLDVTGISIESPQVTLLRNAAGEWNYSSLSRPAAKAAPRETAAAKPSSAPANVSISKFELKNGKVIISTAGSQRRTMYDHVDVTASDFSTTSKFPFKATAELPGQGKFQLDGNGGPVDRSDTSLTPLDAKLSVNSLDLAAAGALDPSLGLGGILDLDANLQSQNGEVEARGTAKISKALLVAGGSRASEPLTVDFDTKYDLHHNSGVLEPSALKIGNAVAHLDGTYNTAGETTLLDIKLEGQNMPAEDLQDFLPAVGINVPKGATLQAGTLNTNLNLRGPTNRLVTTGNVGLFSAKLAGFDLGSKMSAISSLAGIRTGKDLEIEKLTSNLQVAPNGLSAQNFNAVVPALGNLVGGGNVDSKNNLDFKMAAVLTHGLGAAGSPASAGMGMISKLTGSSGCKGQATVPFRIEGTTSDPKFVPDVGGIASNFVKSQLGCAGTTGAGATTQQNAAGAVKSILGLFGKKKKQ
jgi:AsmA protein